MLGNGQSVDLFKLYLVVRKRGGYENVMNNGLWGSVAEECGLASGVGAALKLVYIKYLNSLDSWLQGMIRDKDTKSEKRDFLPSFDDFSMDVESDIKGFLSKFSNKETELYFSFNEKTNAVDCVGHCDLQNDVKEYGFIEPKEGNANVNVKRDFDNEKQGSENVEGRNLDDSEIGHSKNVDKKGNVEHEMVPDSSMVEENNSNRKRKRENDTVMLNWLLKLAKNPCELGIESLPDRSKWKHCGSELIWKQVLLVREVMLLKRNDSNTQQSIWQIKQKMHPTMYDDHTGSERSRCSQRLVSVKDSFKKARGKNSPDLSSSGNEDHIDKKSDSTAESNSGFWGSHQRRKRIPVGRYFQADVPEWTGETYESDPKWLGTRIYPLDKAEQNRKLIERDRIGIGRQDSCGCQFPGSIECVKFHVTERRRKLKLELGSAFFLWKFDSMGEEAKRSWTQEEEKKFKQIVRSNPLSMDKCFWDEIFKCFPRKGRESLVSYYFNVFLLRRRGFQNRTTPSVIDSDDDETECGLSTNTNALPGSIFCSPKKVLLNFR